MVVYMYIYGNANECCNTTRTMCMYILYIRDCTIVNESNTMDTVTLACVEVCHISCQLVAVPNGGSGCV